jgi:ribosomal protein S27AE
VEIMTLDKNLCPVCGTHMEEKNNRIESPPKATQKPGYATVSVAVKRLECPKCHHAEGRHPKARMASTD